jgi:hypothetical protein
VTFLTLFWNWICIISEWFAGPGSERTMPVDGAHARSLARWLAGILQAIIGTVYMVVGLPGAWQLWYWRIYSACRDNATCVR